MMQKLLVDDDVRPQSTTAACIRLTKSQQIVVEAMKADGRKFIPYHELRQAVAEEMEGNGFGRTVQALVVRGVVQALKLAWVDGASGDVVGELPKLQYRLVKRNRRKWSAKDGDWMLMDGSRYGYWLLGLT